MVLVILSSLTKVPPSSLVFQTGFTLQTKAIKSSFKIYHRHCTVSYDETAIVAVLRFTQSGAHHRINYCIYHVFHMTANT